MSLSDADSIFIPPSQWKNETEMCESRPGNQEHDTLETKLVHISDIETGLQFAECDQDVEDELLAASLEEYQ